MALIPPRNLISDKIEKARHPQVPRDYLGYSSTGGECTRKMWYDLHWAYSRSIEARVNRIFRRGDYEEGVVHKELKSICIKLTDDQFTVVGPYGHVKGHIDGIVQYVPGYGDEKMLLEIKTMNHKRFIDYRNKGLRETNPGYYSQIMSYMGKLNLKKCLYIVTNKNDEARDYQIIDYDEDEFNRIESVATGVLFSDKPPEKIGGKTWMTCKYCDAKQICHYGQAPAKNCRTCEYIAIEEHGKWSCEKTGQNISSDEQLTNCKEYELAECLL